MIKIFSKNEIHFLWYSKHYIKFIHFSIVVLWIGDAISQICSTAGCWSFTFLKHRLILFYFIFYRVLHKKRLEPHLVSFSSWTWSTWDKTTFTNSCHFLPPVLFNICNFMNSWFYNNNLHWYKCLIRWLWYYIMGNPCVIPWY